MSSTAIPTIDATTVPSGKWTLDPVHSVASFNVRHFMVGTFRGEFDRIEATLEDGKLVGRVQVDSLRIKNDQLRGHLLSPDFFDAEKHPEIVYESNSLTVENGAVTSKGTLTVKGQTTPVTATGRIAGPVVGLGDVEKVGLDLETTVGREAVGLTWNAPLPKGGVVLGNDVTISVTLEFAAADED
jgi:polyisoprenoid-binding protein YceI